MTEIYEFFPDHIKTQLPALYAQEKNKDPIIHIKFFCPWNQWTWYITEGQAEGEDFLFFGYVVGHAREWGYFVLSDFESVTGLGRLKIERDIHFKPQNASQITDIHSHYNPSKVETTPTSKDSSNLASKTCRVCGERYDTPHQLNCSKRRDPSTSSGEPRVLVKMEDL
jgi:hypothetical protein